MNKKNFFKKRNFRLSVYVGQVGSKTYSFYFSKDPALLKRRLIGFLRTRGATFKKYKPNKDRFVLFDLKNNKAFSKRFTLKEREDPLILLNDMLNSIFNMSGGNDRV